MSDHIHCTRGACRVLLTNETAYRRFYGSALKVGDPYCVACARLINRHAPAGMLVLPPGVSP